VISSLNRPSHGREQFFQSRRPLTPLRLVEKFYLPRDFRQHLAGGLRPAVQVQRRLCGIPRLFEQPFTPQTPGAFQMLLDFGGRQLVFERGVDLFEHLASNGPRGVDQSCLEQNLAGRRQLSSANEISALCQQEIHPLALVSSPDGLNRSQ